MSMSQRVLSFAASGVPGLRRVRRPESASTPSFDLSYVRTGPSSTSPVVIIPGGPGLGSVLPYRGLRRMAARGGLDVIMVEHRGVGLSRTDLAGRDLPFSAMRVSEVLDDIAAVLEHERVRSAFIVGSSYGSYLASGFGARHGERVKGMLLDSALQSSADLSIEREHLRGLLWEGATALAEAIRALVTAGDDQRVLLDITRAAFELGGEGLALPLLRQRLGGRSGLAWKLLRAYATRDASIARIPGVYDFDIAGVIGFRELHYGAPLDGLPMDPALTYSLISDRFPPFTGEPFDLPASTPAFSWPVVVLSGERDLRTPSPIAQRTAETARDAVLVPLENGHSALDTHPAALLNAIRRLVHGQHASLAGLGPRLDQLPKCGLSARLPAYLGALLRVETSRGGGAARG